MVADSFWRQLQSLFDELSSRGINGTVTVDTDAEGFNRALYLLQGRQETEPSVDLIRVNIGGTVFFRKPSKNGWDAINWDLPEEPKTPLVGVKADRCWECYKGYCRQHRVT